MIVQTDSHRAHEMLLKYVQLLTNRQSDIQSDIQSNRPNNMLAMMKTFCSLV